MKTQNIALLLISLAVAVRGQEIIAQHSGANNPTTEGFGSYIYANTHVGGVTNDLGYNAWSTTFPVGATYTHLLNNLTGLSWELTLAIRIVTPNVQFNGGFFSGLYTGSEEFLLAFGSQANGDPEVQVTGASRSPIYTVRGAGSTYNTYQLLYDASSDTASLWIDGVEQFGDIVGYGTSYQPELGWGGSYQGSGSIQANWNLVSLEVIPEPSSLCLLGLGGLATVLFLRKHKRNVP